MSTLGLHLRLDDAELARLVAAGSVEGKMNYLRDTLEAEKYESGEIAETDSSWAYIHAALLGIDPDGDVLGERAGPAAANIGDARYAIMGREVLASDADHYIGLVRSKDVDAVAKALRGISIDDLRRRVIDSHRRFKASGEAEDAAEYAASWFPGLIEFYEASAASSQHVIFNVNY